MELHARKSSISTETSDVLVLDTFQEKNVLTGLAQEADELLGGLITQIAKEEAFIGKANQSTRKYF